MLCKCGCGKEVVRGNRYINHHAGRKRKVRLKIRPIPCMCGCGKLANSGNRYILGHSGTLNRKPPKPSLLCRCGCGVITKPGNTYIHGHSQRGKPGGYRGKKHTEEAKRKISRALVGNENTLGIFPSRETRNRMSAAQTIVQNDPEVKAKKRITRIENGGGSYIFWHPYTTGTELEKAKKRVLTRDKECIICNRAEARLGVHHIVPIRVGYKNVLCDHESNMVVLCQGCHSKIECGGGAGYNKDKWKEFLPVAKIHLSKLGYKEMLLDTYL